MGDINTTADLDIQALMTQKAHELFNVCDLEEKGFITKRDMQRLQSELPLEPDQLESVFDCLDDDGNGFLTLEEFTSGFGMFIGIPQDNIERQSSEETEQVFENEHLDFEDDAAVFNETMAQIGAAGLLEDQETLKQLWARLRRDDPDVLTHFEEVIAKMSLEMRKTQMENRELEDAMRSKATAHDIQVQRLYDEMEQQIKAEKDKLLAEEQAKERQLKEELERELYEKDKQLQELLRNQNDLERKLNEMNQLDSETRLENERLIRQKQILEDKLEHSQAFVEDTRGHIESLKKQQKDEKRERARQAFQITEGIALERESLVKQLDVLREVNKRLKDEKEESWARFTMGERAPDTLGERMSILNNSLSPGERSPEPSTPELPARSTTRQNSTCSTDEGVSTPTPNTTKKNLVKQGSLMSNYFGGPSSIDSDENIECDDDVIIATNGGISPDNFYHFGTHPLCHDQVDPLGASSPRVEKRDIVDGTAHSVANSSSSSISTVRAEPVGRANSAEHEEFRIPKTPERVFKLVFVGDSGVGKTTFIHRYCTHEFVDIFSATIGVDFQVKTVLVDKHLIALQLWDTAGQERFRSITKQYFRKADGVIIMYDTTSETSFVNVRNWMDSVQDGIELGTVLMLLANKVDIAEEFDKRQVTEKDGSKLSEIYSALFYEVSSKTGQNVEESMLSMCRMLQVKEDREMENAVTLRENSPKKKGCWGI